MANRGGPLGVYRTFAQREWLDYQPSDAMRRALALASGKTVLFGDASAEAVLPNDRPCFVVTCNMDGRFVRAGVDPSRVLETEGSICYLRCSRGCRDELYPAEQTYRKLAASTTDCAVPTELIPRCPHCGAEAFPWVRGYGNLLEGSRYHEEYRKVSDYLAKVSHKKVLFIELGVGRMTPMFIQEPFWNLVAQWPESSYVAVNNKTQFLPKDIEDQGLAIKADIADVLKDVRHELGRD